MFNSASLWAKVKFSEDKYRLNPREAKWAAMHRVSWHFFLVAYISYFFHDISSFYRGVEPILFLGSLITAISGWKQDPGRLCVGLEPDYICWWPCGGGTTNTGNDESQTRLFFNSTYFLTHSLICTTENFLGAQVFFALLSKAVRSENIWKNSRKLLMENGLLLENLSDICFKTFPVKVTLKSKMKCIRCDPQVKKVWHSILGIFQVHDEKK